MEKRLYTAAIQLGREKYIAMKKSKKRVLKWSISVLLILIGAFALYIVLRYGNYVRSLASVERMDGDTVYSMTYYGDYYFDEYVEQGGAQSPEDIDEFLRAKLTKGLPDLLVPDSYSCSAFMAHTPDGNVLVGRNFDFDFAPAIVLKTQGKGENASISVSDGAFIGLSSDSELVDSGLCEDAVPLLSSPYLPMDGMNEYGLAIAVLTTEVDETIQIEGAPSFNASTMIRLVLNNAKNVDEAFELISTNNIFWYGGYSCHFMLADRSGRFAVAEYHDGTVELIEPADVPAVTNFCLYKKNNWGDGYDRYRKIAQKLDECGGIMTEDEALDLLKSVCIKDSTQWSVLYNLTTGDVKIYAHENREQVYSFTLDLLPQQKKNNSY